MKKKITIDSSLPLLRNGKPHVSYSEVSTWAGCGYRHNLLYIPASDEKASLTLEKLTSRQFMRKSRKPGRNEALMMRSGSRNKPPELVLKVGNTST